MEEYPDTIPLNMNILETYTKWLIYLTKNNDELI